MSNARSGSYRVQTRQPLIVIAMHVGRICAARLRPVTAGDVQELLQCSPSTAARFLAAYNAVYADRTAAQASGAAACEIAARVAVRAGSVHAADAIAALLPVLRASAARSDEFDNRDDEGPADAAA